MIDHEQKYHSERYKGRDIWAKPKFSEQGKFLGWEGEIAWAPPYQACVISDRILIGFDFGYFCHGVATPTIAGVVLVY